MRAFALFLIGPALIAATPPATPDIAVQTLKDVTKTLSSDGFGGRKPATADETRTTDYIVQRFKAAGLQPGNHGSWYQDVPLVTLTPNNPAPYQKQVGSTSNALARTDDCGITGLTSMRYMVGKYDTFVESLGNHCGTATVNLAADNTINFAFTNETSTEYTGYSPFPGTFAEDDCPGSQVIVGYNIKHGAYMDSIQAVCAPLVVSSLAGTPDP